MFKQIMQRSGNGLAYFWTANSARGRPLLVCLHGLSCRATDFAQLFDEFSKRRLSFDAIAIDLPGHGDSSMAVAAPSTGAFATSVLDLLIDLQPRPTRVTLLGHSMSSRIVQELWTRARAKGIGMVHGLILLDGSNFTLKPGLVSADKEKPTLSAKDAALAKTKMFDAMLSPLTPASLKKSLLEHHASRDPDYTRQLMQSLLEYDKESSDAAFRQIYADGGKLSIIASTNTDTEVGRRPMLLGERSKFMDYVKDRVPDAQEVVITDSAHFPHVDLPSRVAQLIISMGTVSSPSSTTEG